MLSEQTNHGVVGFETSPERERLAVNDLEARISEHRAHRPADAEALASVTFHDCRDEPLAVARYYLFAEPVHGPPSHPGDEPARKPRPHAGAFVSSFSCESKFPGNPGAAFRLGRASDSSPRLVYQAFFTRQAKHL